MTMIVLLALKENMLLARFCFLQIHQILGVCTWIQRVAMF